MIIYQHLVYKFQHRIMMQTRLSLNELLLCGVIIALSCMNVNARPFVSSGVESSYDARLYLQKFNHMGRDNMQSGVLLTEEDYVAALISFQEMANVTVTGILDEDTIAAMNLPRCGMPDNMGYSNSARKKRYAAMASWPKTDLTWRINSYSPDLADPDIDRIMEAALVAWSDVSQLTFTESSADDADIIIDFFANDHGDGNPFDGPGNVLAHAYFPLPTDMPAPIAGDAHFDDAEDYTQNTFEGINLFQVAAHEFGHSLGLGHSRITDALMAPFYRGYVPEFELHEDDVAGIQSLYGVGAGDPEQTMKPNYTPGEGDMCPTQLDAIVLGYDGTDTRTYAFTGNLVYEILNSGILEAPQLIRNVFAGLPDNVDAGFYYPNNGRTYLFKGDLFWRFSGTTADAGYPRPITNWNGIPDDIDAAFVWSGNGRIYFTKGDQYWRFNAFKGRIDDDYPRPLSTWGVPVDQFDTVMQWSNRQTYFFAGNNYYRFNDGLFTIAEGYPRSVSASWFGCGDNDIIEGSNGGLATAVPNLIISLVSVAFALICRRL